ncbi:MAG: patatin-like phospholipase family protein [Rudaea sp.]
MSVVARTRKKSTNPQRAESASLNAHGRAAKTSKSTQSSKVEATPAQSARGYETVALVLQGGGALGAYQCGVYAGLHEAGIRPDWFAGISIGAINAAILAGNAPEHRIARLREFWNRISIPAVALPEPVLEWKNQWLNALPPGSPVREWANSLSAMTALWLGQSGFFVPRSPPPYATVARGAGAMSFYSTAPLKRTLEEFIDFGRINHGPERFTVGAVNVRSGNLVHFDNRKMPIRVEHVMASGALPPAFAAVEIDGEYYWDGGVVSNTPLEYVIEVEPRRDTLALQVDLWSARGTIPSTLADVLEREKDIRYSSRTRRGTDHVAERQRRRLALGQLLEQLPGKRFPPKLAQLLEPWTCSKRLNIVHLIYQAKSYEAQYKDYAFGAVTMRGHWDAGSRDMQRTLAHPDWFVPPPRDIGVVTHDIHR